MPVWQKVWNQIRLPKDIFFKNIFYVLLGLICVQTVCIVMMPSAEEKKVAAGKKINDITDTLRPNKKISVFRVMGLKSLGRVCSHIFFKYFFFLEKNTNLCILKGISPFKLHKII